MTMLFKKAKKQELMTYVIKPLVGVGDIKFGMSREEIRKQMGKPYRSWENLPGTAPTDGYYENQLQISYDKNDQVENIVLGPAQEIKMPRAKPFIVEYKGVNVFETKADELVKVVGRDAAFDPRDPDYPTSYIFPELELSLWRETEPLDGMDEVETEEASYFGAISVGVKGYYMRERGS